MSKSIQRIIPVGQWLRIHMLTEQKCGPAFPPVVGCPDCDLLGKVW